MKKSCLWIASLALCLLSLQTEPAQANSPVRNGWLAFYPDVCQELIDAANDCTLCHSGQWDRNPYGTDLQTLTYAEAASVDSDGDGRTNGDEILFDCTRPGDLTSADQQDSWGAIKVLFR